MGKKDQERDQGAGQQPPTAASAPAPIIPPAPPTTGSAPPPATMMDEPHTAPPPPARLTLQDLRELNVIGSESADGTKVDVVTKGGVALRFPGDEEKAATLTEEQLLGVVAPPPKAPAKAPAAAPPPPAAQAEPDNDEDLSDLPKKVQQAARDFGLKRRHVLGHRNAEDGSVVIITAGGRKLFWPADKGKVLTSMQKGDDPGVGFPRFFPQGHLDGGRKRG